MLAAANPSAQAIEGVLPALRQAQFIEAEHGQRQQGEQPGEDDEHRRRLQRRLQIQAGPEQAHQGADRGVSEGHAKHIGQR